MVGKGCYDTLSSGYDTAFRKSLQLSFPVQDWAHDHFIGEGLMKLHLSLRNCAWLIVLEKLIGFSFSGVVSGKLPM